MSTSGFVIWFTGLPCSGKTTLAKALGRQLEERGRAVELLDGDTVREHFPGIGFSKKERDHHIAQMGYISSLLEKHGVIVLASFVSPHSEARSVARGYCSRFIEIHVATAVETCELRDVKGMYKKAREGLIKEFTGVSAAYEAPAQPELRLDTADTDVQTSVLEIETYLERNGMLLENL